MPRDSEALLRVAEALSDGKPLPRETEDVPPALHGRLRQMKVLARIVSAHREFHATTAETIDPATGEPLRPGERARPGLRWGPLRLFGEIGRGGYGEVYRAYDETLQRDVALKLFRGDVAAWSDELLLDEARSLARVRHPNVLIVHGADRCGGRVGLWTELIDGDNLEELLRKQGTYSAEEAKGIGVDLCRALAAVHAAHLVHRDVKTANVMREQGGRIVLMDFSSVAEQAPEGFRSDERASGTPLFMAPELFEEAEAGPRSDIYSLGVVLYRLVSRAFPVPAESIAELKEKHRRREQVPLRDVRPDLPPAFVQTVERALAADAADRFASAGEMERALLALSPAPPVPGPLPLPWWRGSAGIAAAIVLLAAVLLFGWIFLAPAPLEVEALLYRYDAGAVKERVLPGGLVRPGDDLFMELETSQPVHLYVFNVDQAGHVYVLFPIASSEATNPLPPGRHRLPGRIDGTENFWTVDSAGGEEGIWAIASIHPLAELEAEMENVPRVGPGGSSLLEPEALERGTRGIGGLTPRPVPDDPASGLLGLFEELERRSLEQEGIWVSGARYRNPPG